MAKYDLSIIDKPKGKPGKVVFTLTRHANSITDAIRMTRAELSGGDLVVMQTAALHRSES